MPNTGALLFSPSKAVAKNANSVNGKNVNSPIVGLFGGKLLLPSVYLRIQFPGEKKKKKTQKHCKPFAAQFVQLTPPVFIWLVLVFQQSSSPFNLVCEHSACHTGQMGIPAFEN